METVRHNISYDLLLRKTNPLNTKTNNETNTNTYIYFVICNCCYWCASYLGIDDSNVPRCYARSSPDTELIPIGIGESFRIDYSRTRGMELEFLRNNN
jgi:hypothetical protein